MAISDLNQKYTIEKYCTKSEVAKALGTNLIEPFWKDISEFRKRLSVNLPFYDASRIQFYLTYIDSVQIKSTQTNERVTSYVGHYGQLINGTLAKQTFSRDMFKSSLKAIARINNLDASEITLSNIVERKNVDEQYFVLARYFKALENLKNNPYSNIDESFLADNYALLRGEEELTSFYRTSDVLTSSSKALIDRDYDNGVPARFIDDMMGDLFKYINNASISLTGRLIAILFLFNYIKPFEIYNMELACLLVKKVLATTNINTSSIYIPLENVLLDAYLFNDISKEVKKTHDFTYALLRGADDINEAFDFALSRISEVRASNLEVESKIGSDERQIKEEFGNQIIRPFKEKKVIETKNQIIERIERNTVKVDINPPSEKELKAKMLDLLESDPFLKKNQADFYVHHCVIGKYYTIQQYVKYTKCVYETARTSMDNLALRGYYRREQIKNKFVYTPINKE